MDQVPVTTQEASTKKTSAVIRWALILGIAIVTNLFLNYLVSVLYAAPQYTDFCPERQVNPAIETESACLAVGGQWNANQKVSAVGMPQAAGYCNEDYLCGKKYNDVQTVYDRNVFIVFVVAGIALLIGSAFLAGAGALSLGLSFGGVLALIIGSVNYWGNMDDLLRVVILGVALAALLYVAWKKFRD